LGGIIRRHEGRRGKGHEHEQNIKVLQGLDESSSQFYEHLCEAFCLYTSFDLEATENQRMINVTFVDQTQGDIGKSSKSWRDLLE
jgi:hypothetical protein